MIDDPIATAGLVTREVRSGTRDGQPTKVAIASRTYGTDQSDLWDAVTNAERIPRWFLPISGELEVGGRYQLQGNAGGTVENCAKPDSFTVTWEMGPMISWLSVALSSAKDGATLELTHESHIDPNFAAQFGPGAVGVGWDLALVGLGIHLETGDSIDPAQGLAFPTSPTGIEFIQQAASNWADAAIADGDEPEAARAAAERTVTFYTVVPKDAPQG